MPASPVEGSVCWPATAPETLEVPLLSNIRPHLRPGLVVALALLAAGVYAVVTLVVAGPADGAASAARSLPTNPPGDAKAAGLTVVNKTVAPNPTSTKGFDGFQTVTVAAPAGKTVLQGFATLSGGDTGSVLIQSTKTIAGKRFVVQLIFPGEQGKAGTLHIQVQLLPRQ